jgi:hypothetical protein
MIKLEAKWVLRLMARAFTRISVHFHLLWRLFLLRVIDLEALSIEADVEQYIGQFAGVLLMFSLVRTLGCLLFPPPPSEAWKMEQSHILTMMLVVGLIAVLTWDGQFPDRRDALILGPLPVRPRTILFAKLAATAAPMAMAVLLLNGVSSFACALVLAHGSNWLRAFLSYWSAMIACSLFLFGALLTVQGMGATLLPRRIYMRVSGMLQLVAYGTLLGAFFLLPTLPTHSAVVAAGNHQLLALTPSYWFFALFNQLNGTLPSDMQWLAWRGWQALAVSVVGAALSLLICYSHTMKKIVEQAELEPGSGGPHWSLRLGSQLQTAITAFCWRTLSRSRQHRVILAFYLSIAFAVGLAAVRQALIAPGLRPFSFDFAIASSVVMVFVVMGFRNIFSLPISLTANWMLRTTQLHPTENYIAAARRTLLLFAIAPTWLATAAMAFTYRPFSMVAGHMLLLALLGLLLADASLIGFAKVPFTCSYLPGATNFQFTFWRCLGGLMLMAVFLIPAEMRALRSVGSFTELVVGMVAVSAGLWRYNHWQAGKAALYFEEAPEEELLKLGL